MGGRAKTETLVTHRQRMWLYLTGGMVLLFLIVPVLIVIPMSFSDSRFLTFPPPGVSLRWYKAYFASPEWMDATRVSMEVAACTTLLATPIGVAADAGSATAPRASAVGPGFQAGLRTTTQGR